MINHVTGSSLEDRILKLEKEAFVARVKIAEAYETINMLVHANEILVSDLAYVYDRLNAAKSPSWLKFSKKTDEDTFN